MTSAAFNVSQVLTGYHWTGATITFSFPTAMPSYSPWVGPFQEFSDDQKAAVRAILADIQQYVGVTIVETLTGQPGDITFGLRDTGISDTGATNPAIGTSDLDGGDVYLRSSTFSTGAADDFFKSTVLHEILHALGVRDHLAINVPAPTDQSLRFSASANANSDSSWDLGFATSLQVYDISALQQLYGAPQSFHNGNDTYTFGAEVRSIWDGRRPVPRPARPRAQLVGWRVW